MSSGNASPVVLVVVLVIVIESRLGIDYEDEDDDEDEVPERALGTCNRSFSSQGKLGYDGADDDDKEQAVILNLILGSLALLSLALTMWQWLVARRFPLHQRVLQPSPLTPQPPVTLLKPLKGCDAATEDCLRSWFAQQYAGPTQILFGVAAAEDPVCGVVRKLLQEFPGRDAQLVVCGPLLGANAKVSKLVELERMAKHEIVIVSDADVRVPPDLLANMVAPLGPAGQSCGLVCCFYRLANPTTLAMQWEAIAINADFWSQVLQSRSLKPMDFALGAVMATRRQQLREIGGFAALVDCLADDYQLGNRLAHLGYVYRSLAGRGRVLVGADGLARRLETPAPLGAHHSRLPARALFLQRPEQRDVLAPPLAHPQTRTARGGLRPRLPPRPRAHRSEPATSVDGEQASLYPRMARAHQRLAARGHLAAGVHGQPCRMARRANASPPGR